MVFARLLVIAILIAPIGCRERAELPDAQVLGIESGRALKIKRKSRVGIQEVSGLGKWRNPTSGELSIFAVGDRTSRLAVGGYIGTEADIGFNDTDLSGLYAAAGLETRSETQWEAVAVDGTGTVFIMKENPTELHIFAPSLTEMRGVIRLKVRAEDALFADWTRDANSQGEGFVLLEKSHVLVLKEKDPVLLVEFGPKGEAPLGFSKATKIGDTKTFSVPTSNDGLVPLFTWRAGNSAERSSKDLSELAVDGNGHLYALSDQAKVILSISGKSDEEIAQGSLSTDSDSFRVNSIWSLPAELEKPEGLVFVDDDRPLVALDECVPNENCIFTLNRLSRP